MRASKRHQELYVAFLQHHKLRVGMRVKCKNNYNNHYITVVSPPYLSPGLKDMVKRSKTTTNPMALYHDSKVFLKLGGIDGFMEVSIDEIEKVSSKYT